MTSVRSALVLLINYLSSLVAFSMFTSCNRALVKYALFKINYSNASWKALINTYSFLLAGNSRELLMILVQGLSKFCACMATGRRLNFFVMRPLL